MNDNIEVAGVYLGSVLYLGMVIALPPIVMLLAGLIGQKNIRVGGAGSWIVFALFGGLGAVIALPVVELIGLGGQYAVSLFAFAFLVSFPWIHWVMPALAPDFQIDSFGASLTIAALMGAVVIVAGFASGQITDLIPALGEFSELP